MIGFVNKRLAGETGFPASSADEIRSPFEDRFPQAAVDGPRGFPGDNSNANKLKFIFRGSGTESVRKSSEIIAQNISAGSSERGTTITDGEGMPFHCTGSLSMWIRTNDS